MGIFAVMALVSAAERTGFELYMRRLETSAASEGEAGLLPSSSNSMTFTVLPPRREDAMAQVRRLVGLANEHQGWVVAGCLALFVRLPFSLAIPHFVSEGIGGCIDYKTAGCLDDQPVADPDGRCSAAGRRVYFAVVFLLISGSVDAVLDFFNFHLFVIVQQKVIRSLKLRLFEQVMRQEPAFFDSSPTGDIMSRLTADTVEMSGDISFVFRFSIEAVVRIGGVAGYMFVCSWRLALLSCTMIPANALLNRFYGDWLHKNAKRSQDALAESNATAQEAIAGIRTVKAFAKERFELARYAKSVQRYYELGILQCVITSTYYMVVSTFLMNCLVQAALLAYGSFLVWAGVMPVDSVVSFMLYRSQLQEWVNNLLNSYTQLLRGAGAASRVFALLDRVPQLCTHDVVPAEPMKGHVEFHDVHFAYPSRPEVPVLRGLSFEALPGRCIALVGGSGAGKSTVFHLLMHFYEATSGRVLLDGADVITLGREFLCSRVGVVSQEPILFRGSVDDNIRYSRVEPHRMPDINRWSRWWAAWCSIHFEVSRSGGSRDASGTAVEDAARIANAHDFISALPDGYSSEVGERGVQFSGGQRQRIAIARAVLQSPAVLLLTRPRPPWTAKASCWFRRRWTAS